MSLDMLKPGQAAVVTALGCPILLQTRLKEFGLVPGTKVRCRYRSPAGDVTALEVRGAILAVRAGDLQTISALPV